MPIDSKTLLRNLEVALDWYDDETEAALKKCPNIEFIGLEDEMTPELMATQQFMFAGKALARRIREAIAMSRSD